MRTARFALAMLVLSGLAGAAQARTNGGSAARSISDARKLIERYRRALGKPARRIDSTEMIGTARAGDAVPGSFVLRAAKPDQVRIDVTAGSFQVTECYNGRSAWRRDANGASTLLGNSEAGLRLLALLANHREADLPREGIVARASGSSIVDGRSLDRIDFSVVDTSSSVFFDPASGLPVEQEFDVPGGKAVIRYEDYRGVDGLLEPFTLEIDEPAGHAVIKVDSVMHNMPMPDAAFSPPDGDTTELKTLLKSFLARQTEVRQLQEKYTFNAVETERKFDGDGQALETHVRRYEIIPVAGHMVRKLIGIDRRDLSVEEKERADRRAARDIARALKQDAKIKDEEARSDEPGEPPEQDDVSVMVFLRVSQFSSIRREVFHGHHLIAFDFEPNRDYKPRGLAETIASKSAGRVWVDPERFQVVRMEAHLVCSFKLGGGLLATIGPPSSFVFEQQKIDDVWLPSYIEASVTGRLALFKRVKLDNTTRYGDYKKCRVDSDYSVGRAAEPVQDNRE